MQRFYLSATAALFFLCLFQQNQLFAQTQTIRGQILDVETQTPLEGATVVLLTQPPVGVYTDAEGRFKIENAPVGRVSLRVQYLGYEELRLNDLSLTSGKALNLNLTLSPSVVQTETVVVETQEGEKTQMESVSGKTITIGEMTRVAGNLSDPSRMASAMAGVTSTASDRNDIVARGNSPQGVLWRLEGIDIPNPNHFANPGSSGGGVSALSGLMLAGTDFYTSAFPAEYGNANSAVMDLKLRVGNEEKREYTIRPSFLGIDLSAEGPFVKGKRATFLFNYRYSTVGLLTALKVPLVGSSIINFQDLCFNINYTTAKAGTFNLFAFGGLSSQTEKAKKDTTDWQNRSDRTNIQFNSDLGVVGLKHKLIVGKNTFIQTTLALSGSRTIYAEDTVNALYDATKLDRQRFIQGRLGLASRVTHRFSPKHTLFAGVMAYHLFFEFENSRLIRQANVFQTLISAAGSARLLQAFGRWRYQITPRLSLQTGVFGLYFDLNQSFSVEPRVSARYVVHEKHALSAGYGLHSQVQPLATYFAGNFTGAFGNRNLSPTRAHHFVLGHEWSITEFVSLKTELYYQMLFDVPVAADANSALSILNTLVGFETAPLVNEGKGRNYGLEITLNRRFAKSYYYMATASVFRSRYTALDGVERNTRYDGLYAFNVIGGKEWRFGKNKQHLLEVGGRATYVGGNRDTPIDVAASQAAGETVYFEKQAFTLRRKDYFRTDLRVSWQRNRPKWSSMLSLDLQNVFNVQNIAAVVYDPETNTTKNVYNLGIIPVLSYRVDF